MSSILALSILIRLAALTWSLVLIRRLRDWRLAFLTVMLALMALRQTLTLILSRGSWTPSATASWSEMPGLLVSVMAFLAVVFLGRLLAERQRDARELRASEAKFATAFSSSPDAMVISWLADGKILELNDGFTRIAGYRPEEAVGCSTLELGMWADPGDRERLVELLKRRGSVRDFAAVIRDRSGRDHWCQIAAEIVEIEGRAGILSVLHDVTDQRRARQERAAALRELEARNVELESLSYSISHELKSPLLTIHGFLGYLERDARGGLERRYVERIRAAANTMRQLLDDLLELLRIGRRGHPSETVALAEVAEHAAEGLAEAINRRGVRLTIAPELPVVSGDRELLLMVMHNLIINAVQHMGEQAEPRVEIGVRRDGDRGVCFVKDNGAGIDPRYHDKVFGLFERLGTAPRAPGSAWPWCAESSRSTTVGSGSSPRAGAGGARSASPSPASR